MSLLDAAHGALVDLEERIEIDYSVSVIHRNPDAEKLYGRARRGLIPLREAIQRERGAK